MESQRKDEVRENTCVVCFKEVEIFSIGQCDHPVCFECSTRMRVLCRQNECPICRQEMPTVIFTRTIRPFESIKAGNFVADSKYKIFFSSDADKSAYEDLLCHLCPQCGKVSPNFGHLRDHVRRVHMLIYCDLCVDHLKILTRERRCYSRKDLATHRKVGDPDDRSHRGHPLCEFCDKRYMDNDELYKHLRRDHFYCHFCDADGLHYYYKTYDSLREHFRSDHYLCEEGDCYMEKFTSVFRTDIDLKAHKASAHGRVLGKAALKQARTLDIAFTLAPRPRPQRSNRHHNSQPPQQTGASPTSPREEEWETGAIGGTIEEPPPQIEKPPQPVASQLNTNCIEEFPSLGGAALPPPPVSSSGGSRRTVSSSLRSQGQFTAEDFPALGPETSAPAAPVTSVTMRVNTERPSSSSNSPPQTNLSIQVSSPRFTTTVSSKKTYNLHFPALDENSGPPVVSSSATVQWTAKKKNQKESQTSLFQPSTVAAHISKSKPVPKMDDFPALEPKSSNKPLFPKNPPKISTASNTVSTKTTLTEDKLAQSKSKKKKSKSKSASGTSSGVDKKKTVIETGSNEPSASARSAAYEKRAQLLDGMVETEPDQVRLTQPSVNLMTEEELMLMMRGSANEKENRRESANKPVQIDESAFPSLPGFGPPPGFEAKWEVKNTVKKSKGPPPGLTAAVKTPLRGHEKPKGPPPGLDLPAPCPPPGFTPVNGSFPPLSSESAYVLPPSFDRRNTSLVDKIAKALGTDALNDFKQISFAFRSSLLGATEYYHYCKDTMGDDSFISIFPELLALLPEIGKQQELWPHYKVDKDRFEVSLMKGSRLDACATCGQVLRSGDLKDHLSRHSLDNHFPSLDQKKQTSKNAWSK